MTSNPHSLLPRKFSVDSETPLALSLVKMRLPVALPGPGSILDSSAVTGATRKNYHTAIVRSAYPDFAAQCIRIRVWPVPSYSFSDSSTDWVATQSQHFRDRHIPFPSVLGEDQLPRSTPTAFGTPLQCGAYHDRRPSWVFLREIDFELPFTQTWKRFNPTVLIPPAEMGRLELYYNSLSLPAATLAAPMFEPAPTAAVYSLFASIFEDAVYSDDGEDEDDERSCDAYALLRAMAPGRPEIEEVVEKHDRAERERKVELVREWRKGIM